MTFRRMTHTLATGALTGVLLLLTMTGCTSGNRASEPEPPPAPQAVDHEVTGTLVALKDDRPVDGGINLTLETAPGSTVLVRVPSIFRVPPRDSVRVMHEVVDSAKVGDRLRARGARDESGVLVAQTLERMAR